MKPRDQFGFPRQIKSAMNIRHKCITTIGATVLLSATLNIAVLLYAVFPTFLELENESAISDLNRVIAVIDAQIADVRRINTDYSTWDDSYRFANGEHDTFIVDNLYANGIENIEINFISIHDRQGTLLYEAAYQAGAEEAAPAGPFASAVIDPA